MALKVAHIDSETAESQVKALPLHRDPRYLRELRERFITQHNKQFQSTNEKARVAAQAN